MTVGDIKFHTIVFTKGKDKDEFKLELDRMDVRLYPFFSSEKEIHSIEIGVLSDEKILLPHVYRGEEKTRIWICSTPYLSKSVVEIHNQHMKVRARIV